MDDEQKLREKRERDRQYRIDRGPEIRAAKKAWRVNNPDKVAAAKRRARAKWRKTRDPEKWREQMRRDNCKVYGITLEQYEAMLLAQEGLCVICRRPPPENKRLGIDHDHSNGRVRGLLCTPCNVSLGVFEIDDRFARAQAYLDNPHALGLEA